MVLVGPFGHPAESAQEDLTVGRMLERLAGVPIERWRQHVEASCEFAREGRTVALDVHVSHVHIFEQSPNAFFLARRSFAF